MRKVFILAFSSLLLCIAGLALAFLALNRNVMPIATGPVHPVTEQMVTASEAMSRKAAPSFNLPDVDGTRQSLKSISGGKPTFVYFIKDGCPCSVEAEPILQKLYAHLNDDEEIRVPFIGIIGSDPSVGKKWVSKFNNPYPVLCSPDKATMKAYESPNSVYGTLIDSEGRIIRQWPGWSKRILNEINIEAAKAGGFEAKPFDTAYAPIEDSSGCSFYED